MVLFIKIVLETVQHYKITFYELKIVPVLKAKSQLNKLNIESVCFLIRNRNK
jgi:hypothetical protein